MTLLRSFASAFVAAAILSMHAGAQADCKRPAPRQYAQGETVTLSEAKTFPCKIVFADSPTSLRAEPAKTLGQFATRGPDGRFYTTAAQGAEVQVWTTGGQFIRSLSRGDAGAFPPGGKYIDFDRDGRVFVADNLGRWSVFSPQLEYLRTVAAVATGNGMSNTGFFTGEGLFVGAGPIVARTGGAFGIFDFSQAAPDGHPRVVRQFGAPIMGTARIVAPATGLNFWAAPRDGPGAAYEIELWRTDGTLLRTIRRDVPWFPRTAGEPSPEMEILADDGTGVILAALLVPNAEKFVAAAKATDPAQRRALQESAIEIYFEAIDSNAGVVLASWGPVRPSEAMKTFPSGFFPRSRTGYRIDKEPSGVSVARIVELRLVAQ